MKTSPELIDQHEEQDTQQPDIQPINLNVTVEAPKRHLKAKAIAAGLVLSVVLGTAYFVSEHMPHFPQIGPSAHHDLDVEITDVKSMVVHNKTIRFADVASSFSYKERNSLDKWGPFNCDATVTGRVKTAGEADVLISEATISRTGQHAEINVTGDITSEAHADVDGGLPKISIAVGGEDICNGENERDWANRITFGQKQIKDKKTGEITQKKEDGVIKNAGEIATACAIQKEGEAALADAIVHNASVFSEKLEGLKPENITVSFEPSFKKTAQQDVDRTVAEFYQEFNSVAEQYYGETDDHVQVKLNAGDLVDCTKHRISVKTK